MIRHPSAEKRHRQSLKRREHNRWWKSRVRSAVRKVMESVESKDRAVAEQDLRTATKEIHKARTRGILHANTASRRISRLARLVGSL